MISFNPIQSHHSAMAANPVSQLPRSPTTATPFTEGLHLPEAVAGPGAGLADVILGWGGAVGGLMLVTPRLGRCAEGITVALLGSGGFIRPRPRHTQVVVQPIISTTVVGLPCDREGWAVAGLDSSVVARPRRSHPDMRQVSRTWGGGCQGEFTSSCAGGSGFFARYRRNN